MTQKEAKIFNVFLPLIYLNIIMNYYILINFYLLIRKWGIENVIVNVIKNHRLSGLKMHIV